MSDDDLNCQDRNRRLDEDLEDKFGNRVLTDDDDDYYNYDDDDGEIDFDDNKYKLNSRHTSLQRNNQHNRLHSTTLASTSSPLLPRKKHHRNNQINANLNIPNSITHTANNKRTNVYLTTRNDEPGYEELRYELEQVRSELVKYQEENQQLFDIITAQKEAQKNMRMRLDTLIETMPPPKKPASNKESKKTVEKKKEKIVEDKTFGLKNKKGAKTQKFIQQVHKQVKGNATKNELPKQNKKEEKRKELEELNAIFRPVTTQKVERGVDPKSVLCSYFKQGQCSKGDKCKFSHDLKIGKKAEKKSVYVDLRDQENKEGMENWDEATLREAVEKKHGESNKGKPKTDIICKYFIDALENNKYGWFWECPSEGNMCHYRHALPPGFVLNKDKKKADKEPEIALEELIEVERSKLAPDLPKLTLETFIQWKRQKIEERKAKLAKEEDEKRQEFKAGRHVGLSGREMFTFNPELATDNSYDEGEVAFDSYARDDDDDENNEQDGGLNIKEIDLDELMMIKDLVIDG